jgi:hypothetical protein
MPDHWYDDVIAGKYHAFISYRHKRYAEAAQRLHNILESRGLSVFLDVNTERLGSGGPIEHSILKRELFIGVSSSVITLFFEAEFELEIDAATGRSKRAFSWQFFEKLYSSRFIMLKPPLNDSHIELIVDLFEN